MTEQILRLGGSGIQTGSGPAGNTKPYKHSCFTLMEERLQIFEHRYDVR